MSTIVKSSVYSQETVMSVEDPRNEGRRSERAGTSPQGDSLTPFVIPYWLEEVSNSEHIRNVLAQRIPEFASGQLKLQRCKVKLRLEDESGCWTGTCLLTVEDALRDAQGGDRVVPVRATLTPPSMAKPGPARCEGAFGSDEWFFYIPELYLALETQPLDTGLTGLPILTDAEQSRVLLEENIRDSSPKYRDFHIQRCTPHVMRYKPNSRCTVLYDLAYEVEDAEPRIAEVPPSATEGRLGGPADRGWPELVVAKTYRGDKGRNAYEAMCALWDSPLGISKVVTVAEPLAYIPDLKVMVQGPIREEITLEAFIRSAVKVEDAPEAMVALRSYIRKTAVGLAELHQSGVQYGQPRSWETELADVYQRQARLGASIPQLAEAVTPLLKHLEALAAAYPADPLKPAHGTFRAAQVLLNKGEIGFIDFDSFCQAEPAMDLAEFIMRLKHIGLGKGEADKSSSIVPTDPQERLARLNQMEALCGLFLVEYEAHAPITRQRLVLWETLNLLMLLFGCWTKIKLMRLDTCLFMLEHHLRINGLPPIRSQI